MTISDLAADAVITISESLPDLTSLHIEGATVEISADQNLTHLNLSADATLNLIDGATLTIAEGGQFDVEASTVNLDDGHLVISDTAAANFSEAHLIGTGDVQVAGTLDFDGALQPGTTNTPGNLRLATTADSGSISLTGDWTMAIDVLTAESADQIELSGNVILSDTGSVVVKTDTADLTDGTTLTGLVTLPESVEAPTTLATTATGQEVETAWNESGLQIDAGPAQRF